MGTVIPYAFHVVIQELKDYYGDDEGESQILLSIFLFKSKFYLDDCGDEKEE